MNKNITTMTASNTQTIEFNGMVFRNVIGETTNGNREPVVNLTTGQVYASQKDAAKEIGLTHNAISLCCSHPEKSKTAGGFRWCKLCDLPLYMDEFMENVRKAHEITSGAAERKAKEDRRKALEEALSKANRKAERLAKEKEKLTSMLEEISSKIDSTETEIYTLCEELESLNA